jgi:3-oxoadipate enol-lactonase
VAQDRAAPLEKLRVPTLVITSDEDRVYPPGLVQRMAQRIPGSELVVLEACGHLSNLEQPERFNQALLDFLQRNS